MLLDGKLVNSCLVLAPQAGGRNVVTIEGVRGADGGPNDLQQNFIDHGAVQCGYCIPGMVLAGEALLAKTLAPDAAPTSARRSPATSAAARATSRSSTPSRRPPPNGASGPSSPAEVIHG